MKKLLITICISLSFVTSIKAQYSSLIKTIEILEQKRGISQKPIDINLSGKKFILINDTPEKTQRIFLSLHGSQATLAEIWDNKETQESQSNVYSGDFILTKKNILSVRLTHIEKELLDIPKTYTFLLSQQDDIYYLIELNTKLKWIDEKALSQHKKIKKNNK